MNKKHDMLAIFTAGVTGIALLTCMIIRTFLPRVILPKLDALSVILLSLIALVLDYYIVGGSRRDFRFIPLYSAFIFGIFPYAASFTSPLESLKLALLGAVCFTSVTYLFDTLTDRLSSSPASKAAPFISAFGLYLSAQCLMGII